MRLEYGKQQINGEIHRISNYISLRVSYWLLISVLAGVSVVQMLNSGIIVSFWLFVVGIVLPLFAGHMIGKKERNKKSFVLSVLVRKYQYSEYKYKSLANSFLIELLLLLCWQYSNRQRVNESYIINIMPSVIIMIAMFVRLGCYFLYWMLIKYKLKYNQL